MYHRRKIGLIVIGGIQLCCYVANFTITTLYDFSASYKAAKDNYFTVYYGKPYNRIAPYMLGLVTALFLYAYKNDEATNSRMKRWMDHIDTKKWLRMLMYLGGTFI